ncbi:MAG TPA: alpha-1,2-fucosyltransferase [Cyclobacteriaceae bacterium]|nr:alpha-1,2-fucosyltransferase [Cyclobacteriaceae bacterium]
MIIVRLRGGLGNQLFQYAAARALADHHRTELKLDLYTYTRHQYRKFELTRFNITATEATRSEVHQFTGSNPVTRYVNKRENYFRCPKVFAQPHYHFYDDFFSLPDELYLSGYWQSERYFHPASSAIKSQFTLRTPLDDRNASLQKKMLSENSVAVHVRRGDYTASGYNSFFGLIPMSYYVNAIEKMRTDVVDPVFYIFSDDPSWCRQNFSKLNATIVDFNPGDNAFKDMVLMSSCANNIIANSTFSWWGAWLNSNPQKKVIAPRTWFRTDYLTRKEPVYPSRLYNTKDLIPQTWVRL